MELIAAAHVDSPFEFAFAPAAAAARQLVLLEHATLGYQGRPPVLERLDFGILAGRPHRAAGPQRRRQVDAAEGDRRHAGAARGHAARGAEPAHRLLRAAPGRAAAARAFAAVAPAQARAGHARAGAARLPRRLRLSRRHGHRPPSATSPAARRRGSRWRSSSARSPTCCCSTSRPTISTSRCARR